MCSSNLEIKDVVKIICKVCREISKRGVFITLYKWWNHRELVPKNAPKWPQKSPQKAPCRHAILASCGAPHGREIWWSRPWVHTGTPHGREVPNLTAVSLFGHNSLIRTPFRAPFSRAFSCFRSRFIQIIHNLNKCVNLGSITSRPWVAKVHQHEIARRQF